MRKICCVAHHHYDEHPHMRRDLETLVENGYNVDVICLGRKGQKYKETIKGVNVYRIPLRHHRGGIIRYLMEYAIAFILFSITASFLHLKKMYSAIEVDNMPDYLVFSGLVPKFFGARIVLYIFDNVPEYFAFKHGIDEKHPVTRVWRFIEGISASFSDHVIVTQSAAKETLQRHGIPGSKITVVLNTPKEGIFYPIEVQDSTNNNERFVIMTHGVILHSYGNQTVIQAIPILIDRIPELEVRIVGFGEYLDKLKRLAKDLRVEDYIVFTGRVPHSEIPGIISEAAVGIVPKLVDLMLPVKLMEYVAMGKPVVASAQPTMKAYFDNSSIMFFEPGNEKDLARCILEIYLNPSKGRAMAYCASKQFEKYKWEVVKYDYLGIYESLLSG